MQASRAPVFPVLVILMMAATAAAETLLTEPQALQVAFPKAASVDAETKSLTAAQREELQKKTGLRFPEPQYRCFVARGRQGVEGYAVIMNEVGKHEFITFIVAMNPKLEVSEVAVMEYRESRGWEVKEQRFLRQFRGKKSGNPLEVNHDIVNYTGATLSSHAVARGVKKALALAEAFYR